MQAHSAETQDVEARHWLLHELGHSGDGHDSVRGMENVDTARKTFTNPLSSKNPFKRWRFLEKCSLLSLSQRRSMGREKYSFRCNHTYRQDSRLSSSHTSRAKLTIGKDATALTIHPAHVRVHRIVERRLGWALALGQSSGLCIGGERE